MRHAARIVLGVVVLLAGVRVADAATVTRGPYLQMPTESSIVVRWRTDVATTSQVAYGGAPGMLTQAASDAASTTEHVVTVTGLAADTLYYYSIGATGTTLAGNDADHWFRTAPVPGTAKPMRLWTIGDAGFTGANLDAVRDAYATFNGESSADLFLLLGDNAYLLATDAQYQAAVFDEHRAMLRTTPVWSVFGNHEAFSSSSVTQTGPYFDMFSFPMAGEVGGVASGTEAYYSFDYADVHFVVLDSEQAPTSSSTPMLTWLEADLQDAVLNDPAWIVALWHRPPYSKGLFHDSDVEVNEVNMRQFALPILEDYGVDLVLCGHSHSYERSYFLDSHYGLSSTFSSANQVDSGDGDPEGDGAYRKEDLVPSPHAGAVYVVNGSGSEVRNATLNHPALLVGLLEVGSVVVDIDGNALTARFLNGAAEVKDTFRIIKGGACGSEPAVGCGSAEKGKLQIKGGADPAKGKWSWKWSGGTVDAADIGDPAGQTDLAACVYDANGALLGGSVPRGAAFWKTSASGAGYSDKTLSAHGIQKIKLKFGDGSIQVKAKGEGIAIPVLPATFPVTAQLVNLDNGACWESVFSTAKKNDSTQVQAQLP